MRPVCWITMFSLNMLLAKGQKCVLHAIEGRTSILTCPIPTRNKALVWQIQEGKQFVNIASCNSTGSCRNLRSTSFLASRTKVQAQNSRENYTDELRIINSNRTQKIFQCINTADNQSRTCELQVYILPDVPQCQIHPPTNNTLKKDPFATIVCSSQNIYPQGLCVIDYKGLSRNISTKTARLTNTINRVSWNFKTECSWHVPMRSINPDKSYFQVGIYPNVSVANVTVYTTWLGFTNLSFPTVALASSCPAGRKRYIQAGTPSSCKCEVRYTGLSPGFAQWYTESRVKVESNQNDSSSILNISYNNSSGSRYICELVNSSWALSSVDFTPRFAVGPTSVTSVTIEILDGFSLCPNETFDYKLTCRTSSADIVPGALFTISINNQTVASNKKGLHEATLKKYTLEHRFRPKSGGSLIIYCKVTNEIFSALSTGAEKRIVVNEPPTLAPDLKTNDDQPANGTSLVTIPHGRDFHLTCQVHGGSPPVTNTTILCGNESKTATGNNVTFSSRVATGTMRVSCHCTAHHVTGCYDKLSEVVLIFEEPAKVISPTDVSSDGGLGLGLGVGLGCASFLFIVLVIAVAILFKRKRDARIQIKLNPIYSHLDAMSGSSCHDYQEQCLMPESAPKPAQDNHVNQSEDIYVNINQAIYMNCSLAHGTDQPTKFDGPSAQGTEPAFQPTPDNYVNQSQHHPLDQNIYEGTEPAFQPTPDNYVNQSQHRPLDQNIYEEPDSQPASENHVNQSQHLLLDQDTYEEPANPAAPDSHVNPNYQHPLIDQVIYMNYYLAPETAQPARSDGPSAQDN